MLGPTTTQAQAYEEMNVAWVQLVNNPCKLQLVHVGHSLTSDPCIEMSTQSSFVVVKQRLFCSRSFVATFSQINSATLLHCVLIPQKKRALLLTHASLLAECCAQ